MFCEKCGEQLPDDARFCGSCGNVIGGATPVNQTQPMPASSVPVSNVPAAQPAAQSDKGVSPMAIIIVAAVAAVAIVGIVAFFLTQGGNNAATNSNTNKAAVPAATTNTAANTTPANNTAAENKQPDPQPQQPGKAAGAVDLNNPTHYRNINLYVSNFTETNMHSYDRNNPDMNELAQWAYLHNVVNRKDLDAHDLGNMKTAVKRYFGIELDTGKITRILDPSPNTDPNKPIVDGKYAGAMFGQNGGYALCTSVESLGNQLYKFTYENFFGVANPNNNLASQSVEQARSAKDSTHCGSGTAIVTIGNPNDESTFYLISLTWNRD